MHHGMRLCLECGFRRDRRSPAARERHRVVHEQWRCGVRLHGARQFEVVGTCLEFQLLLCRPGAGALAQWTTDLTIDQLLRDQPNTTADARDGFAYPLTQPKPRSLLRHAVLASNGSRVVGGLFFEWRPFAGIHYWNTPIDALEQESGNPVNDWCVSYAWLHRTVRRRHIGPMVALAVARGLNRLPEDFLFLPPFTRKGASVSRAVSPHRVRVAKAAFPDNYNNLVYPFAS